MKFLSPSERPPPLPHAARRASLGHRFMSRRSATVAALFRCFGESAFVEGHTCHWPHPRFDYRRASIHVAVLRLYPQDAVDMGFVDVVTADGFWTSEHSVERAEQRAEQRASGASLRPTEVLGSGSTRAVFPFARPRFVRKSPLPAELGYGRPTQSTNASEPFSKSGAMGRGGSAGPPHRVAPGVEGMPVS